MWSATWPKEVQKLASRFLGENPIQTQIGDTELCANANVKQIIRVIDDADKTRQLNKLVNKILDDDNPKTIIFAMTKKKVDELVTQMRRDGIPAMGMHGDKEQRERDFVLAEFKRGTSPFLVATDVASRGLDVKDIKFVINYDYPNSAEDYVHRIGRTGRAGAKGTAYTFFTTKDAHGARDLIGVLRQAKMEIPSDLEAMQNAVGSEKWHKGGGGKRGRGGGGGGGGGGT